MKFLRKTGSFAKRVGIVVAKAIGSLVKLVFKFIIAFIIVGIVYFIVAVTINAKYAATLKGTCIEANEFGAKKNIIRAKPLSKNDYYINNAYKHDEFAQKVRQTDLNLALNGDPVTINIVGQWIPWFGDLKEEEQKIYNPDNNFFCALEKYTIPYINNNTNYKIEEKEFYYIKNYYSGISILQDNKGINNIVVQGIEEPPERQKECWITRGAGLYLGVFGTNGRTEPSAYHHIMADKLICNKAHWFNGHANNNSYVITDYIDGFKKKQKYTLEDFKKNYFSISYYLDPENPNDPNSYVEDDKKILTETQNQIIYNINTHEELLRTRLAGKVSYGLIVAQSMAKFNQACYRISRGIDGQKTRSYNAYFRFGPKTLYKHNPGSQNNLKYDYGEKVKMLIVDKFYDNNQGFYRIEIVSGIEFDDADYIEKKIKEVEFYLLGTPNLNDSSKNRSDGMIARIFNNVLSSKFILFSRAVLILYVVIYGFRIIFGFKKDRNDKSVINRKDLMTTLFKFVIIATITSPVAFSFFSETILNFVINGTIGIIDMVASSIPNSFFNNSMGLSAGLQNGNKIASLSKNFAIVDEILNFFTDKTLFSKVFSFFFNLDETFGCGIIIAISLILVLLFYVYKLIQAIIPFIFVLLQFTLVLPLAPLFLLFGLFKETSFIMQNWLKFIFSKCLELIGFFTAFYFCTSIIDNFIKKLLNYKVCFKGLGDHLIPVIKGNNEAMIKITKTIKDIMNNFVAVIAEELPASGPYLLVYYIINILITATLVAMFDIMTKEIMTLIGSIITIDGATANVGGGDSVMKEGLGGKLSLSNQFQSFNETMGFAEIQKTSDHLSWTRGVLDLSLTDEEKKRGKSLITKNLMKIPRNVNGIARFSGKALSAGGNFVVGLGKASINIITRNNNFNSKKNFNSAKEKFFDGFFNDLGKSIFTYDDVDENNKPIKHSIFSSYTKPYKFDKNKKKSLSDSVKDLVDFMKPEDYDSRYVSDLLNMKTNSSAQNFFHGDENYYFKKYLKNMSETSIKRVFTEEVADQILSGAEITDDTVKRLKNYLEVYKSNNYYKKNMEYDNVCYDAFSENYGNSTLLDRVERNQRFLAYNLNFAKNDPSKLTEAILESDDDIVSELLGEELAEQFKRLKDPENNKNLTKDEITKIREKVLAFKISRSKDKSANILKDIMEQDDGEEVVENIFGKEFTARIKQKIKSKNSDEKDIELEDEDLKFIEENIIVYKLSQAKGNKKELTKAIEDILEQDFDEEILETILGKELVERIKGEDNLEKEDLDQIQEKVLVHKLYKAKDNSKEIKQLIKEVPEEIANKILGKELVERIKDKDNLGKEDLDKIQEKVLVHKLDTVKDKPEEVVKIIKETLKQEGGDKIVENIIKGKLVPDEISIQAREELLVHKLDTVKDKPEEVVKIIKETLKQEGGDKIVENIIREKPKFLKEEVLNKAREQLLVHKLDTVKDKPEEVVKIIKETLKQDNGETIVETILGKELVERIKDKDNLKKEDLDQIQEKFIVYKLDTVKDKPEEVEKIIEETLKQEGGDKIVENIIREKPDLLKGEGLNKIREKLLVRKLYNSKDKPEDVVKIIQKTLEQKDGDKIIEAILGKEFVERIKPKAPGQPIDLKLEDAAQIQDKIFLNRLSKARGEPGGVAKIIKETLEQDGGEKVVDSVIRKELDSKPNENRSIPKNTFVQLREEALIYKLNKNKDDFSKIIEETLKQEGGDKIVENIIREKPDLLKEEVLNKAREELLVHKLDKAKDKPEEVVKIIEETLKQKDGDKIIEAILGKELVERIKDKDNLGKEDLDKIQEKVLVHKLDTVKDKPEEIKQLIKEADENVIKEVFGEKNAEQLIKVKNGELELTDDDMRNMKHYMKKLEEDEPISDSVNHDIFSDDYGREKKHILADNLSESISENDEDKKKFVETIREQLKEVDENVIKEVFGVENVELVKNIKDNDYYEITDDDLKNLSGAISEFKENNPELTINKPRDDKPDVICEISEGENEYTVKKIENSKKDGSKEVDVMALFDQDGTVLFEIKDSDCIISSGDTKYIISSGEDSDLIITAYKNKSKVGVVINKKEVIAQKVEAKMAKYKKMMEEAKKYEESKKNEVPNKK